MYSSYGYACGIKDGQRHYYDMENGELVYVASALSPTEHYMGATVYQRLSRGKYRFTSANGSAVEVPDIIFYSGRGDGGLLMCRSYTNRMYGVITVNGDIAYDYTCRYKPTITDDGKIIVHKFNGLYDLVEVIYPD